ncbi:DUF4126 domain-containing protein [Salinactinospora qingdaonensis]|uniref:DUF4126 domain-containing protein n=1 Tax=Salinactinospora qingdaonensis TaxID=702744 RepID=A0ABP7FBF6_9ACTN
MLEVLTGTGLASAAGLNAYVPLLAVGLVARSTDVVSLSPGWQWLENPVVLAAFAVLLAVELVADKVPALDSLNDLVQTFVRPTSGGVTFGAGASSLTAGDMAASAQGDGSWWPVIVGALVAFGFHALKALARPVLNTLTAGVAGPVTSTLEDIVSIVTALLALLLPLLLLVVLPLLVGVGVWAWRVRARRRAVGSSTGPP